MTPEPGEGFGLLIPNIPNMPQFKISGARVYLPYYHAHRCCGCFTWPSGEEHFKLLGDMLDTLEAMIARHKADSKAHFVDVTTKWLTARSKAT